MMVPWAYREIAHLYMLSPGKQILHTLRVYCTETVSMNSFLRPQQWDSLFLITQEVQRACRWEILWEILWARGCYSTKAKHETHLKLSGILQFPKAIRLHLCFPEPPHHWEAPWLANHVACGKCFKVTWC